MSIIRYNIRVYGLYFPEGASVMVTDEYRKGMKMTKFPGGGHELGEGIGAGLIREFREELGWEIELGPLVYLNDFFQVSAFSKEEQIISIYYEVKPLGKVQMEWKEKPFDFEQLIDGAQSFRLIPLSEISEKDFTFPIDKKVAEMIRHSGQP